MKIYNTLTRQKEEFVPITPGEAKIYACGPTVYNYIHIGNARPICVFDVLRRYLEYRGMKVTFVQNFTDIDDKIIRKANEENSDYLTVQEGRRGPERPPGDDPSAGNGEYRRDYLDYFHAGGERLRLPRRERRRLFPHAEVSGVREAFASAAG